MRIGSSIIAAAPRHLIAEIVFAAFWAELLTLALPLFAQLIFDKVIVHGSFSTLYVIGLGVFVAALFEGLLAYFYARHVHLLSASVDEHLTSPVLDKLLALPLNYYDSRPKGDITASVRQIQAVRDFLSATYLSAAVDVVVMGLVLVLIAAYSPLLAGIVGLCIPLLMVLTAVMRPVVAARYRALNQSQSQYESLLSEGIQCMGTIKAFSMEPAWRKRWGRAHESFVDATLRARKGAAIEESALRVLQRLVVLGVLTVGAVQVLDNDLSLGQLLACYMLSVRVLLPSTRIFQVYMGFIKIKTAVREIDEIHQQQEERRGRGAQFVSGDIEFRDIEFRYGPDMPLVLNRLNLTIPLGSYVGIIGQSGSGKSTLSKLLQKYLTAQRGTVLIAGKEVDDIDLQSLRQNLIVLTHDAALFRGSVRENILGGLSRDDGAIGSACDLAHATEFLQSLPEGLDTILDERGTQLSSGQRQRIALARAVYAKPNVLVLDEATNALDTETEFSILQRLRTEFTHRTLVVVTHRAHVLKDATAVVEIVSGETIPRIGAQLPTRRQPLEEQPYAAVA